MTLGNIIWRKGWDGQSRKSPSTFRKSPNKVATFKSVRQSSRLRDAASLVIWGSFDILQAVIRDWMHCKACPFPRWIINMSQSRSALSFLACSVEMRPWIQVVKLCKVTLFFYLILNTILIFNNIKYYVIYFLIFYFY